MAKRSLSIQEMCKRVGRVEDGFCLVEKYEDLDCNDLFGAEENGFCKTQLENMLEIQRELFMKLYAKKNTRQRYRNLSSEQRERERQMKAARNRERRKRLKLSPEEQQNIFIVKMEDKCQLYGGDVEDGFCILKKPYDYNCDELLGGDLFEQGKQFCKIPLTAMEEIPSEAKRKMYQRAESRRQELANPEKFQEYNKRYGQLHPRTGYIKRHHLAHPEIINKERCETVGISNDGYCIVPTYPRPCSELEGEEIFYDGEDFCRIPLDAFQSKEIWRYLWTNAWKDVLPPEKKAEYDAKAREKAKIHWASLTPDQKREIYQHRLDTTPLERKIEIRKRNAAVSSLKYHSLTQEEKKKRNAALSEKKMERYYAMTSEERKRYYEHQKELAQIRRAREHAVERLDDKAERRISSQEWTLLTSEQQEKVKEHRRELARKWRRDNPEKVIMSRSRETWRSIPVATRIVPEEIPIHYHHVTNKLVFPLPKQTHMAVRGRTEMHRKGIEPLIKKYYPGLLEALMEEH